MRVYIAGPMTGIPQYNVPAFDEAAANLRSRGHEVQSPAELDDPEVRRRQLASPDGAPQTSETFGLSWGDFLSRDVKLISDGNFDAVFVLAGWHKSRGARLETFVASRMQGLPIVCWECDVEIPLGSLIAAWADDDVYGRTFNRSHQ